MSSGGGMKREARLAVRRAWCARCSGGYNMTANFSATYGRDAALAEGVGGRVKLDASWWNSHNN
eukprot:8849652-Prorocentrum_lima.AAC.1